MSTAYQKVEKIIKRNEMMRSEDAQQAKTILEQMKKEEASQISFNLDDNLLTVGQERVTRWLNAFFNDDTRFIKIYSEYESTATIFGANDYIKPLDILPHIIMSIISHQHTDTIKFVLSECNIFPKIFIKSLYQAALYSENIPVIKHLVEIKPEGIDVFMLNELIQRDKYEIINLLFNDEEHIKRNHIITDIINYALSYSNTRILDIIKLLAEKCMPDYLEFNNPELAEKAFIRRNINSAELFSIICDSISNLISNCKDVGTDVLDYLVDMDIKIVDASKLVRLCAIMKQRTYDTNINSDILLDYIIKLLSSDAYISCSYMASCQSYNIDINDELIYILKTINKRNNKKLRLILNGFNPISIYEFKISEMRILLKYCTPEADNIISDNSLIPLLIEKDKYTILGDIVKGYDLANSEIEYMIEMCVNLKKIKCLNVLRKYCQQ